MSLDRLMGIDAHITPEKRGHTRIVSDAQGRFARMLATMSLADTVCLRFIDQYGQTIFNSLQLPVLLEELQAVALASGDEQDRLHLQELVTLVGEAIDGGDDFVTFIGD